MTQTISGAQGEKGDLKKPKAQIKARKSLVPKQTIEQIKQRANLIDIVGRYVDLQNSGKKAVGRCPFHDEKTPSFYVYPDHYHCFGCDAHGDVFNFYEKQLGLSFTESINKLASDSGVKIQSSYTQEEIRAFDEVRKKKREQSEQSNKQKKDKAAKRAKEIWDLASKDPQSDVQLRYLKKKGIQTHGVRFGKNPWGNDSIIIPIYNIDGNHRSNEYIWMDDDGKTVKRFHPEGELRGNFFKIGEIVDGKPLYVAEGFSTGASVYEAKEFPTIMALSASNLEPVINNLRAIYPKNRNEIIIAADNDSNGTGLKAAEEAANLHICKVVYPVFPKDKECDQNGVRLKDFNDLHLFCGIEEAREQLKEENAQRLKNESISDNSFRFLTLNSLIHKSAKPNWIIKNYFDAGSLGLIFGDPGCMKSFLALDMGLCVATGRRWHDSPIKKQGAVFYIAGEGFTGLSRRLRAWTIVNQTDPATIPFFVSDRAAQFSEEGNASEVVSAIEKLKSTYGNPVLVIVDTLNRNFGSGDENSTADMTTFINLLDLYIRARYGCGVLIVHHSPLNDKNRARGASSLHAALDWSYKLRKEGNIRELSCTKVKDYDTPEIIKFEPVTVELGLFDADDGKPLTSCVLMKTNKAINSAKGDKEDKLHASEKLALDCLFEIYNGGKARISEEEWRAAMYKKAPEKNQEAMRKAFQRAKKGLIGKNRVEVNQNNEYRPIGT